MINPPSSPPKLVFAIEWLITTLLTLAGLFLVGLWGLINISIEDASDLIVPLSHKTNHRASRVMTY